MKLFAAIVSGSILVQLIAPWWSMALVAFVAALLLGRNTTGAFVAGFAGAGLSWLLPALYLYLTHDNRLADQLAQLFRLSAPVWLFVITFLLSAVMGGLAAAAGAVLRTVLRMPAK